MVNSDLHPGSLTTAQGSDLIVYSKIKVPRSWVIFFTIGYWLLVAYFVPSFFILIIWTTRYKIVPHTAMTIP